MKYGHRDITEITEPRLTEPASSGSDKTPSNDPGFHKAINELKLTKVVPGTQGREMRTVRLIFKYEPSALRRAFHVQCGSKSTSLANQPLNQKKRNKKRKKKEE